jgi:tagatose 1,6-diphosphate aldolase
MLSFGQYRRLQQCSSPQGVFSVLAIDHRANLVSELRRHRPVTTADVQAFKTEVIRWLSPMATAVLTDPDDGFPSVLAGALPGDKGLLAPLEVTDYTPHPSQRMINLIPDWDVGLLSQSGCSGAKLLLYYHPGAADAAAKTEIVDRIVAQCQAEQIPLFLEPIAYSLDPAAKLGNEERLHVALETSAHFSARGVDVLKLEFPVDVSQEPDEQVWSAALQQLDDACAVPWTLLSAGAPFEVFLHQAELACRAGASGVIAGRALWGEAVALDGLARTQFLRTVGVSRMRQLAGVCHTHSLGWVEKADVPQLASRQENI